MTEKNRIYPEDSFSRQDETDDSIFYAMDRFVEHLDSTALATIENMIGQLLTGKNQVILDLMASWDSHIPQTVQCSRIVGLGLNQQELNENDKLTERVVHDINKDPKLPLEKENYDAVICTVSIDYVIHPQILFREVGRVLKPGGLFLVIFSNRYFPPKVVKIWRESSEEERLFLVQDYFKDSRLFEEPHVFSSMGKPRPPSDKYADLGIPSDPVYAVYAYKKGGDRQKQKMIAKESAEYAIDEAEIEQKKKRIKDSLLCPYCGVKLKKWRVPQTPFTEWPNEFQYICFNDECVYYIRGWDAMNSQGNPGSYRMMYNPETDSCHPIPVFSHQFLRDGIVDDEQ